jgi:glycosyltransferase involved in cell wall biosynthesis
MNLLYLLPFWPSLYTPWLFREVAWLRGRGHRVAVITLGPAPGPAADLNAWGLADVPVLVLERPYGGDAALARRVAGVGPGAWVGTAKAGWRGRVREAGLRQGTWEWAAVAAMVRFARQQRTQVVEAHWATQAADAARELHLVAGLPYALRLHGGDVYRAPSPHLPRMVAHAGAVCPVSGFLADLLRGQRPVAGLPVVPEVVIDPAKLRICHHGLPEEAIARAPAAGNGERVIIASIGRLDEEKRHVDLLEAVAGLLPEFPTVTLRLIGGGRLEPALRARAEQLGCAERLEVTGALAWDKVLEAVGSAQVYAHAAAVEGGPLASLEGAARGLPLVLSRTGAQPEMVDVGVNGYLFDPGDVEALRGHLRRVLAASAQQRQEMGGHSLEVVRARFRFEKVMPRVEAILDAVRRGAALPE